MCPIWPLHLIIIYLLALCPLWVICQAVPDLTATFIPDEVTINMNEYTYVNVSVSGTGMQAGDQFTLLTSDPHLAEAEWNSTYQLTETDVVNSKFEGNMRVSAKFLGITNFHKLWLRDALAYGKGSAEKAYRARHRNVRTVPLYATCFMPMWLFSLGQVVFRNAQIVVPYTRIATFVIGLLVPLGIGLGMQRWTPKIAAFMIVVAGMGIPWLGYCAGYLVARLFRQPHPDALAISIETGIQNTVVPVSCAIMTPIPMTCIYIYQKVKACFVNRGKHKKMLEEDVTPRGDTPQPTILTTADLYGRANKGLEDVEGNTQTDVSDVKPDVNVNTISATVN
ncbi:hypothetical protein HF086_010619 [Spodoptera exigua]|uniref:Uncharacterized protein n=1 Tax=Spodoptera exigua TaxID=7107 RepID=A0A922MUP4_SPOEX|nr:hypothetical protein HF086_010619 [Spodoptera exigua]